MQAPPIIAAADIATTVSQRLSAIVQYRRADIADLSAAMGIEARRARRILAGDTAPTLCEVVLAARFLGVKTSVLVGEILFTDPAATA